MPRPIGLRAAQAAALVLLLGAVPGRAQVPPKPPTTPSAAPPAAPDPAFEAMRVRFEALPEAERKGLQDALVWIGDYNSVVSGTFGRRTFEALSGAQAGADPLAPEGRAAILRAGEAARKAVRFAIRPDPASGIVLGVPEQLLPKRSALPGPMPAGTRWQSADGRITLESRAFPAGAATLDALFERATAPIPERRVTYKLKRPDFLVVAAETLNGRSYLRYASGATGVRGFTLGYDKALAPTVDRIAIAVANSFVPFPDSAPVAAAVAPASAKASATTTLPAAPMIRAEPAAASAPAATGLVVAPGRVLTAAAAVAGCNPRIGGAPGRIVRSDPARGLALIEAAGLRPPVRLAIRSEAAADGLVVLAAGSTGVSVASGAIGPGGLLAPLQPGAAGAPVLDRTGRLAGLVARYPAAPRLVAGIVPPLSLGLVPGDAVSGFLQEAGIETGSAAPLAGGTLGAVAGAVRAAIVAIDCPR